VQPSIVTRELSLGYADHFLLKAFSATINTGEFIGIFGPNGAGKTTFLRALLGLIKPLSGTLEVKGTDIGYMPQLRHNQASHSLSAWEVVAAALQGSCWGLPFRGKKQREEVQRVLAMVGAETYAHRPVGQLSGGERQRLLLAQALFGEPQILLLDEPLAHLDPKHQDNLLTLIQSIQKQLKATVLFTAHDVNPLLGVMDRVMYIAEGNAVLGTVDAIITSEQLTALYESPIEVVHYADRLFVFNREKSEFEHAVH
jgi:zinc/manganese transport system ATP-binding protein